MERESPERKRDRKEAGGGEGQRENQLLIIIRFYTDYCCLGIEKAWLNQISRGRQQARRYG